MQVFLLGVRGLSTTPNKPLHLTQVAFRPFKVALAQNGFVQSVAIIDPMREDRLNGCTNGGIIPHAVSTVSSMGR